MDRRCGAASSLALILALSLLVPAGALAKGPPGGGAVAGAAVAAGATRRPPARTCPSR